jgi:hypothetical protein
MTKLLLILLPLLSSCSGMMPDVVKMVHDIEDTAIVVEVNRDAIQQDTDVEISVSVINKDPPKVARPPA